MKYDVIVVGGYSIDLVFTGLPHFPELGKDTVCTGFEMIPGEAYTPAVVLHRLGLKIAWAADFGNDDFSRLALRFARAEGLSEEWFSFHDRSLIRISVAASLPKDRAFMTYYDPDPEIPAGLKAVLRSSTRSVYIPGLFFGPLFETASLVIKTKRIKIIMDGNSGNLPTCTNLNQRPVREALKKVDVFLPNATEACNLTGETDIEKAARLLSEYCPLVVIKNGAEGAIAYNQERLFHVPAIKVTPLDTTGAGDCFSAAFAAAWLKDRPLLECIRWGNIAGGLSTLKAGGTGYRITTAEIASWLSHYQN